MKSKKKKKPVVVKWAKVRSGKDGTSYSVWIGNAIVGWESAHGVAILRTEAANAELSRLVANRDRRLRRKGGAS